MKERYLNGATLDMIEDVRKFKIVNDWRRPTIDIYDDYIECSFRISHTLRCVPESSADEWRMYAEDGEIVLVFTYYYLSEDK